MASCKHCHIQGLTWVETGSGFKLATEQIDKLEAVKISMGVATFDEDWLLIHGYPTVVVDFMSGQRWASHSCELGLEAWKAQKVANGEWR